MNKVVHVLRPIQVKVEGESFNPNPKKKVAAYARVSTDYEDQINSYKVQCEEYSRIIKTNPDFIFAGIYADQGLSGTQAKKRPEFIKMINAARNGEIDLIITKSISRFGRNTLDVITYIRELRDIGVEIFFEKENISSLDPKIDFMLTILSSVAQEESRSISSNVKWSYDKKFRKGIVDARRILGYNVEDGKYVVNTEEAKIIKQIYTLALKRYKISDIVKTLNSSGLKTLSGKNFMYSSVRYILNNERYCGDAVLRKTVTLDYLTGKAVKNDNIADKYYVENNHEPIISRENFKAVQIMLNDNTNGKRNMNKTTKYPLTGILRCPKCGRTLKRQHIGRGKKPRVILNCNHSYDNKYNCSSPSPEYDLVIGAAIDSVNALYSNTNVLNSLFEVFDNNIALNNLRNDLEELKVINRELINLHHEDTEDEKTFKKYLSNTKEIESLSQELAVNLSTSIRLDYIKSLVKKEYLNEDNINFKDIYSLILADDKKITFVISPVKTPDKLAKLIKEIDETESILSKMYVSKNGNKGIYYEVKIYE